MFEIDVEESFAAGHALRGYVGKCENLHGHNYRVRLTVAGDGLDRLGLLCDFKDVKNFLNEVIGRLDHQYLNNIEPFKELNPSAENIARYVFRETNSSVSTATQGRASVKRVKVWETDRNAVTYIE